MASPDNDRPENVYFVKEINYDEIQNLTYVGKGSFGVVSRGEWKGMYVAVKNISTEAASKVFTIEVRQLSKVNHENIVQLHGVCTTGPNICLVMEYAEGGSLSEVLDRSHQPIICYKLSHALSWVYQCAKGVEYLHAMKPKPLIHRDLKPANLLLVRNRKLLKICDFGTATNKTTYMTNSRGSPAWMAPEVFSSSHYTEKCDVFSWGIILWEVLSRKQPLAHFDNAFSIMWAINKGVRPPLLRNCPKPLEDLMVRCWGMQPSDRPSMAEVVLIMSKICSLFNMDEPIEYSYEEVAEVEEENDDYDETYTVFPSNLTNNSGLSRPLPQPDETLSNPLTLVVDPNAWELNKDFDDDEIRAIMELNEIVPPNGSTSTIQAGVQSTTVPDGLSQTEPDLDSMYLLLDSHLRPATPDLANPKSAALFEEHKQLAQDYLKVQTELALLSQKKDQLQAVQTLEQQKRRQRIEKLQYEKEQLVLLKEFLQNQVEREGREEEPEETGRRNSQGWVIVNRHEDC